MILIIFAGIGIAFAALGQIALDGVMRRLGQIQENRDWSRRMAERA